MIILRRKEDPSDHFIPIWRTQDTAESLSLFISSLMPSLIHSTNAHGHTEHHAGIRQHYCQEAEGIMVETR